MWQCECSAFNNDEHNFCPACKRIRVDDESTSIDPSEKAANIEAMFRRIQDFILIDVAFMAIIALYCFLSGLKEAVPVIVLLLFQIFLVVNLIRLVYQVAMTTERNSVFLHKIHDLLLEKNKVVDDERENHNNSSTF